MAKNSLKNARARAFQAQNGCCYYCRQRMNQSPLTVCTAEHLRARSEGGGVSGNIVAACLYCNSRRHRRKKPMAPLAWQAHVMQMVEKLAWPTLNSRM